MILFSEAQTISFTSGEGYTDAVLGTQNSWVTSGAGASGAVVSTAGSGTLTLSSNNATVYDPYKYNSDTLSISTDFTVTTSAASSSGAVAFRLGFTTQTTGTATDYYAVNFVRSAGGSWYLNLTDNTGTTTGTSPNSTLSTGTTVGFSGANVAGTSSPLTLTLNLNKGVDSSSWSSSAYLYNGSTLLTSLTGSSIDSSAAFYSNSLSGFVFASAFGTAGAVSSVSFDTLTVVPEPATNVMLVLGVMGLIMIANKRGLAASR